MDGSPRRRNQFTVGAMNDVIRIKRLLSGPQQKALWHPSPWKLTTGLLRLDVALDPTFEFPPGSGSTCTQRPAAPPPRQEEQAKLMDGDAEGPRTSR